MRNVIVSALIAAAVSLAIFYFAPEAGNEARADAAFEKVAQSGRLRCAYWSMQPLSYRDPNTGELKGFAIDLFDELSKRLGVKVDWVEEVNFATMMAGLETDRYDAICTGVFLTGERARVMEYTSPYLFSSVVAVARADDTRFDADVKSINAKEVRISVQDGVGISLADRSFPEAQKVQLPDMASPSQQFVEVETGKADVAFTDASDFIHYSEKNPGKLRMIHADRPLSVYPWVIAVRKGEHSLASFINGALAEMIYSDEIRAITKRNGIPAGTYGYLVPNVAVK